MAANNTISYIIRALDKFTPTSKNINKNLRKQKVLIKNLNKNLEKSKYLFAGVFAAQSVAFTGMVIGATKFQSSLSDVFTLLDKPTLKKFGDELTETSLNAIKMGFSMEDANKALFDSVSAIGDVDKSIKLFDISQKLAIGGATNLSTAVDGLTSVVNAYGKETTNTLDVANAFFSAQRAGKTTVELLAQNVGKVAPIAKTAGIGFKTLLATMSQLTLGGLSTEEASTALRGAISGLIKPTDAAIPIFRKFRIPIGAAALQSADFTEVLNKLAKAAKENPNVMAEMIPNIRALTAISALGTEEVANLRNIIKDINVDISKGTGLQDAFNLKMEDASQKFKMLKGRVKVLAVTFGTLLLPKLIKIVNIAIKFLDAITALPKPVKIIILAVGLLATAFTGLLTAIAGFLFIKTALIAALAVMKTSFILTWIAATGPIGILIAGIITIIALGAILFNKWKPFRDIVLNIWGILKKISEFGTFGLGFKLAGKLGEFVKDFQFSKENKSKVDVNIAVDDKGGNVKEVKSSTEGISSVNIEKRGLSMAGA